MTSAGIQTDVGQLFRRHGALVYHRALRLMGNRSDAEEAVQEVFVRVMRSETGYDPTRSKTSWLSRITTNYCLNRIRDRKRRGELFEQFVAPEGGPQGHRPPRPGEMQLMRWLLANAEEQQARAAVYVYLDGMSHAEAARELGVAKRTVGNLLERFRTWAAAELATRPEMAAVRARRAE